ncbi:MAG: GNAT family N-acetyltransferase [Ktedonobacteraceae bacterium]|nr:GNAT family N-acetyltransferase [Ktedonobacteraceae bacterium]
MVQKKIDISLRDAREGDREAMRTVTLAAYEQYAKVIPPAFWDDYRKNIIETIEEGPAQRIVAEYAGRVVGSVLLYPPAQSAYGESAEKEAAVPEMRLLAVDPAMRGHGIGNALTWECVERARQMGAPALGLHTADIMQTAMQMYERMGFVRVPELDFHPTENTTIKGYRLYFA